MYVYLYIIYIYTYIDCQSSDYDFDYDLDGTLYMWLPSETPDKRCCIQKKWWPPPKETYRNSGKLTTFGARFQWRKFDGLNLWLDGHTHTHTIESPSLLRWRQKAAMDKRVHQQLLDWYIRLLWMVTCPCHSCPMKLGVIQSKCLKSLGYHGELLMYKYDILISIQLNQQNKSTSTYILQYKLYIRMCIWLYMHIYINSLKPTAKEPVKHWMNWRGDLLGFSWCFWPRYWL